MNKITILIVILFLFIASIKAQEKETIQLSGIITNDSSNILSFVNIINIDRQTGTYSDKRGIYSLIVQENDSIIFTCVGFKPQIIVIPDSIKSGYYNADIKLIKDTIAIAEIIILPWKNYEEFKKAFVQLKLPDDDLQRARKNIAIINAQMILFNSVNPDVNFRRVMQQEYEKTFIQGQYSSITLLNPANWAEFIKSVQEGKYNKKE